MPLNVLLKVYSYKLIRKIKDISIMAFKPPNAAQCYIISTFPKTAIFQLIFPKSNHDLELEKNLKCSMSPVLVTRREGKKGSIKTLPR